MHHVTTATPPDTDRETAPALTDESGSMVAEYGLLAVAGATVCGALITFAGGSYISTFFTGLLDAARSIVGAS
ncbi:hypothetical protein FTX61_05610 [Nitriliruptoraceae bacterium ZYF776]|nr:hypothetical protein [Profundirhabdus halotolerans]